MLEISVAVVNAAAIRAYDVFAAAFGHVHPVYYPLVPYWVLTIFVLLSSPITMILPQFLKGQLKKEEDETVKDEWTVHGRKYNLRPFLKEHPGGEQVLRASNGTDITGLFESYHIFIDRDMLLKRLARYEIVEKGKKLVPLNVPADPFHEDLKKMVKAHFKDQPKGSHKMSSFRLAICLANCVLTWTLAYHSVTTDAMWCIPILGCCAWYTIGNVMHDASHIALVKKPWLNNLCSYAAFPFGFNQSCWHIQHVTSHHVYTNTDQDVDLHHFDPVLSLEKGVKSLPYFLHYFRLFTFLSSALSHLSVVVPYALIFGQVDALHGHRMYDRYKEIRAYTNHMKTEMSLEVLALFFYWAWAISHQGVIKMVCYYVSVCVLTSYMFVFFTQASHLQEECFPEAKEATVEPSFMKRQIATSLDHSADSLFWSCISGGLNTQAIHHCMPSISAMHLIDLYPEFRRVCKQHGVALKEAASVRDFCRGFLEMTN